MFQKEKKISFVINLFLIITFLSVMSLIYHTKNNEIENYKNLTLLKTVDQTQIYLKALIREKQNATATIALGLANSENIINSLKYEKYQSTLDLHDYSLQLRRSTDFKNVWFQLTSKEGISIQRSWRELKNDKIANARADIQEMIKDPKIMNNISIGRFDMTFKSMIPVYDPQTKEFLGIVEAITHFNSIANNLASKGIKAIILADKRYKDQLDKAFTKIFIDEYYVANYDADKHLMKHIQAQNVENYLSKISRSSYYIDEKINSLVSYYTINDNKDNVMGHFILVESLKQIEMNELSEIDYVYNLYYVFTIFIFLIALYFADFRRITHFVNSHKAKLLIIIIVLYAVLFSMISWFIYLKYQSDIEFYKQNITQQSQLEYNSIVNKNNDLAELILYNEIDTPEVKELIIKKDRNTLYELLKDKYAHLKQRYNVRQIHFHLPDSTSFLRMHRPELYGDSLVGIRQSVEYVNKYLRPYSGFEEGKVYNGFRYVYPLFDSEQVHIGSVEISFDIYSFMDHYFQNFKVQRVNFLIKQRIVDDQVFKEELKNYIPSPIKGFYFDKLVINKLNKLNKTIIADKKNLDKFKIIEEKIEYGMPFTVHFDKVNEIAVIIPFINKITGEVVGSINVSNSDQFIKNRMVEFKELMIVTAVILALILLFAFREVNSRINVQRELDKTQIVLDSQRSFILITDGKNIKASNKKMLDFFGYENLEEFKKDQSCICEFFEFEEGKGYIQKQMNDKTWFEYIFQKYEEDNLAKMKDTNGNEHIFYVEFDPKNKISETDYVISFIDITHIKNIEVHLRQTEKMASLGSMIGNIAHQWRQPLSAISSLASGVKLQSELEILTNEHLYESMDNIVDTTKYLSDTIDTFRDYAKTSKEKVETSIQDVIEKSIQILQPILNLKNIQLDTKLPENPIVTHIVAGELSQVITNLINNAKDVLVENEIEDPTISIECFEKNEKIHITIQDNAGGVPEEIIEKIFEPYFTTKHQSQGTGLGLYMSHKIVTESLHGTILVNNAQNGAVFTIILPLNQ